MTKTKSRAANLAVPQSREEAADFLRRIGEANRQVDRLEADMNDRIAAAKTDAAQAAQPLAVEVRALTEGLRVWCDANRAALTDGNKVKFADLGSGKVFWRFAPPKVTITGVEAVIQALKDMRLARRFLRVKEEVDREAMLRDPDAVKGVPGVKIGSAGEDFVAEPFEAAIAAGPALAEAA